MKRRWTGLFLMVVISCIIVLVIDQKTNFIGLKNISSLKNVKIYHFFNYKKAKEKEAEKLNYRWQLNDRLKDYWQISYENGIGITKKRKDIWKAIYKGKLVLVENNEYYVLDTMFYSYPYLTPKTKKLLDTIGYLFQKKIQKTDMACSRLNLTSLLRSTGSVARLTKRNKNAVKNSAHLHGTAFDLSYVTYYADQPFSANQVQQMGDSLAKIIYDLRTQKKCFATYETWQTCFHVVAR